MLHSARSQGAPRVMGLALMIALAIPVFSQAKRALTNETSSNWSRAALPTTSLWP